MTPAASPLIRFACRSCGRPIKVAARHAGARLNCPQCRLEQAVPSGKPHLQTTASRPAPRPALIVVRRRRFSILTAVGAVAAVISILSIAAWVGAHRAQPIADVGDRPVGVVNAPARITTTEPLTDAPAAQPNAAAATADELPPPASANVKPAQAAPPRTDPPPAAPPRPEPPPPSVSAPPAVNLPDKPRPTPPPTPETFINPRSRQEIEKNLTAILLPAGAPPADERTTALRRLCAYRYLCQVPYDVTLDDRLNHLAQAAADICRRNDALSHDPANPGMPPAEYNEARLAAANCNLHWGFNSRTGDDTIVKAIDGWMDDSDESNVARLGHRRWCLNPKLLRTGFGRAGRFSAMWALNQDQLEAPDYEFISFPPPGLTPIEFFDPKYAWSILLHPVKFRPPEKDHVAVRLYPARGRTVDRDAPLAFDHLSVDDLSRGGMHCVIFRPKNLVMRESSRYWLEIDGLERNDGTLASVAMMVEFMTLLVNGKEKRH